MVVGRIGNSGVVAVSHVAVDFKDAHELVPALLRKMEVLVVRGIIKNPKLAISMDAQLRVG